MITLKQIQALAAERVAELSKFIGQEVAINPGGNGQVFFGKLAKVTPRGKWRVAVGDEIKKEEEWIGRLVTDPSEIEELRKEKEAKDAQMRQEEARRIAARKARQARPNQAIAEEVYGLIPFWSYREEIEDRLVKMDSDELSRLRDLLRLAFEIAGDYPCRQLA